MDKSTVEFLENVRLILREKGDDNITIQMVIDLHWDQVLSMMHSGFTPADVADYLC